MPRSLRIVFIFAVFLLILIGVAGVKDPYPLREFISGAVEHLLIVVTAVLVGAILLWIVEEAVEHHIAPAIRGGLETLATAVKEEVGKFPKSWEGLPEALAEVRESIGNAEVRTLASEGRTKEAVQKAESPQDKIKALVQSSDPADWDRAVGIVDSLDTPPPGPALTLAYLCWQAGKLQDAIRLSEKALRSASHVGDADNLWKIQNSLAYYYAETNDPRYEKKARESVAAARLGAPSAVQPVDTEAYIKITFGRTREEVLEGIALAEQAKLRGTPFEMYAKNIGRADQRLRTFPQPPQS